MTTRARTSSSVDLTAQKPKAIDESSPAAQQELANLRAWAAPFGLSTRIRDASEDALTPGAVGFVLGCLPDQFAKTAKFPLSVIYLLVMTALPMAWTFVTPLYDIVVYGGGLLAPMDGCVPWNVSTYWKNGMEYVSPGARSLPLDYCFSCNNGTMMYMVTPDNPMTQYMSCWIAALGMWCLGYMVTSMQLSVMLVASRGLRSQLRWKELFQHFVDTMREAGLKRALSSSRAATSVALFTVMGLGGAFIFIVAQLNGRARLIDPVLWGPLECGAAVPIFHANNPVLSQFVKGLASYASTILTGIIPLGLTVYTLLSTLQDPYTVFSGSALLFEDPKFGDDFRRHVRFEMSLVPYTSTLLTLQTFANEQKIKLNGGAARLGTLILAHELGLISTIPAASVAAAALGEDEYAPRGEVSDEQLRMIHSLLAQAGGAQRFRCLRELPPSRMTMNPVAAPTVNP